MDGSPAGPRGGRHVFGVFDFEPQTFQLWKAGRPVPLRLQGAKLLAVLLERPGEVVLRDELQRALWNGDTFVDFEQGLNHAIRELRTALGDTAESPRFIQTLPRRGYRFLAPVSRPAQAGVPETARLPEPAPPPDGGGVAGTRSAGARGWWTAAAAAATVALIAGTSGYLAPRPAATAGLRVAVRPFATAGIDASAGVGLANAIASRLGGQQAIPVRPDAAGNREWTAGVTHVLSGDVTQRGATIEVVSRLQAAEGTVVWSEPMRVHSDQLFDVEAVIAERVVAALRLRLAGADQERLRRRYTSNAAAYEEYLRGRSALVRYTAPDTRAAVAAFERALSLDSGYALARAGLAMACADMYLRFAAADEVDDWGKRADAEARAALDMDPDLAEAHLARAAVARKREFDWNATIEASRRALVLNPNLAQARLFMAAAYYHLGYMEEALIELEKGRSLHGIDPVEPVRIEALVSLFSGGFAPARARLEDVSRMSSGPIGDTYLALAYYYSGSAERGRTMLTGLAAHRAAATASRAGAALAGVLAAGGDAAGARREMALVLSRPYRDHHVAYLLGAAHAQLKEVDQALSWLRIAADTGFPCLPWFERDPLLVPLRRHPEYEELLRHVRARRDSSLTSEGR